MRALIHYTHIYHSSSTLSLSLSLSSILVRSFHVHRVICQTGTMELVQELLMTAFVALIFSFFLAKLVSIATSRDTEPGLGLKAPSDNVRGERVLEETKFDGGLRVQRSKSNRRVRFADESVQKIDKFEAFEEKWGTPVVTGDAAGPIEVVDAVTNLDGLVVEGKKVEEIETEIVIKNEGKVATADLALEEEILDELKQERAVDELEQPCCSDGFEEKLCDSALICDSEGRVKVVEVIGGLWVDSSAEQLQPEAADIGCSGVDMIKEEGVVGNLDGLVVEEGSRGKKVDDVERVSIKEKDEILTNLDGFVDVIEEERVKSNLDGLVVEEVCKGKKADDVERVSIKEEGVVTNLDGLVVEDDGLVVEEGSEGKEVDDVVSVIKEDDAVTSLDGMGVKEGGERKVVDDVESVINEGNEKEDADDIEKRCEGVKGEDTGNEINEEGLVTGLGGLVDKEGGKEVDDVESLTKEGNPMEDLVFEGKIDDNANVDVGDVESVIKEGNVMTGLVFEGKITENADADVGDVVSVIQEGNPMAEKIVEHVDAGCKVDIGSTIDDIVVAQDAKVSDMESGIEQGLNTGDVKEEEPVGDEEDDWEGIERSDLDEAFAAAAKYVASGGKDERLSNMGSDVQMQLYGLHKVAMEGPCHEPQPMVLKISPRAKWNAWQRMGNMDPEVAMEQYIALLSDKIPGWMEGKSSGDDNADSLESGVPAAPHPNRSMDPYDQHNSTKKRELKDSGADGGV